MRDERGSYVSDGGDGHKAIGRCNCAASPRGQQPPGSSLSKRYSSGPNLELATNERARVRAASISHAPSSLSS